MGLEVSGVDHYGLLFAVFGSETSDHLRKDAFLAPPLPPVVKRFGAYAAPQGPRSPPTVRTVGGRGVAPAQAIAVDEDNPT